MKKLILLVLLWSGHAAAQDCSTADHTPAIQAALNTQSVVILAPGLYCINGVTGLNIGSNTTFIADGATLQIKRCAIPQVCKIMQTRPQATNIRIRGGLWLGDLEPAIGFSVGLRIDQAEDVLVEYLTLRNWRTDGIQVTGNTIPAGNIPSRRVEISHITSEFSVRNGMSVVNADDVFIHDSVFQDVTGNNPAACLDVEPNGGGVVNNLIVVRSIFRRCRIGIYDQKGQGDVGRNHSYNTNVIQDNALINFVLNCVNGASVYKNSIANSPLGLTIGGFAAPQNCLATDVEVTANLISGSATGLRWAGALRPTAIGNTFPSIQQVALGVTGDTIFTRNVIAVGLKKFWPAEIVEEAERAASGGK